jgi:hypothetical protein
MISEACGTIAARKFLRWKWRLVIADHLTRNFWLSNDAKGRGYRPGDFAKVDDANGH